MAKKILNQKLFNVPVRVYQINKHKKDSRMISVPTIAENAEIAEDNAEEFVRVLLADSQVKLTIGKANKFLDLS